MYKQIFMKSFLILLMGTLFFLSACKSTDTSNLLVPSDEVFPVVEEMDFSEYEGFSDEIITEDATPTVRGIYNPSRTLWVDLVHTKLDVSFDWKNSQLLGKATVTMKPHFYSTDTVTLDAKGMDINNVTLNGKKINFTYDDQLHLRMRLDKVYKKDEKFTVIIDYVAKPEDRETSGSAAISSDKGLYFINPTGDDKDKTPQIWTQGETEANSVWFPTIDAPNAKTSQEIFITVEEKYLTLSNGKLISSKKNGNGTRTDYWKQDLPHAPYLFMMFVGEFKVVKDFYTRQDGTKMDVNYYVEPAYEQDARAIFGETPAMIKFFSERLGVEYPWDKYSQVVVRDYVSGAMENTGAVIFGDFVYKNKRELLDGNDQSTIAHELFHHWFGDLVTCESWANLPLNESFANYSQYLWDEFRYGIDEADFQAEQEAQGYYNSSSYQGYHNLIWFDHNDKEGMFDGHSYNKGGRILHMLRNHLGDEAFFKGLNNYLVTNKYKAAEVHNLRLAFEEVTGQDLNWFFNQWFLGKGHPVIFTEQTIDAENKTVSIKVKQRQNIDDKFPIYFIPAEVAIWDNEGKRIEKVVLDSLEQQFTFTYSGELKNVLFDNQQMLLGRFYEEKPLAQYVHQFKNMNRWKAKSAAFNRIKGTPLFADVVDLALSDKFWNIRELALTHILEILNQDPESLKLSAKTKDLIISMASSDPKPTTKSKAIETAIFFAEKDKMIPLLINAAKNDSSYTVQGNTIALMAELASRTEMSEELNVVLDELKATGDVRVKVMISQALSQSGDPVHYDFIKQVAEEKLSSGDALTAFISFVVYVAGVEEQGDYFDWMESVVALTEQKSLNPEGQIKIYLARIVQYEQGLIANKIEQLNTRLAEEGASIQTLESLKAQYENLVDRLNQIPTQD